MALLSVAVSSGGQLIFVVGSMGYRKQRNLYRIHSAGSNKLRQVNRRTTYAAPIASRVGYCLLHGVLLRVFTCVSGRVYGRWDISICKAYSNDIRRSMAASIGHGVFRLALAAPCAILQLKWHNERLSVVGHC
jgi:hypothetical protein